VLPWVAGTDAAIEAADVALMSDDLQKLPQAITIARHARAVIMQNVAIALAMKHLRRWPFSQHVGRLSAHRRRHRRYGRDTAGNGKCAAVAAR
jgi:hypothetical protein